MKRLVAIGIVLLVSACADDVQQRLNDVLQKQGIKQVVVTDAKVTATCSTGATADVDASELDKNPFGMVKSQNISNVANKLYKMCDDKDSAKRRADGAKQQITDEAKQLGIDVSALDDATAKKAICDKLTSQLPVKDPDRTVQDAKNQNQFGCPPAPAVTDLPTGAWQIEMPPAPPAGKKASSSASTQYARLFAGSGEKLTIRCQNKKTDVYLQLNDAVKKGTKAVDVKAGNAKPAKWKVKPSTDGKALFFTDVKPVVKSMSSADAIVMTVPGAKKDNDVSLPTKGLGETMKKMPKECQ